MAKPYDATTKQLVEAGPAAWREYMVMAVRGPVTVMSADLATVTAEADHVLRVDEPEPWLVHLEFQTGHDPTLPSQLRYNVLLNHRHGLPVRSAVLLRRPAADGRALGGQLDLRLPGARSTCASATRSCAPGGCR